MYSGRLFSIKKKKKKEKKKGDDFFFFDLDSADGMYRYPKVRGPDKTTDTKIVLSADDNYPQTNSRRGRTGAYGGGRARALDGRRRRRRRRLGGR